MRDIVVASVWEYDDLGMSSSDLAADAAGIKKATRPEKRQNGPTKRRARCPNYRSAHGWSRGHQPHIR